MNTRQAWNINAVFLLLIFGFTAATLLVPKKKFSETENRSLAQMPAATVSSVLDGSFENGYEAYLTDQFPARDVWIRVHTAAGRAALKQDVHDIYFAEDDYLIEKHTGIFTTQKAKANIMALSAFCEKLSRQTGTDAGQDAAGENRESVPRLTVMIATNAVSVLTDKLPLFASPYDETLYLGQIRSALPENVWADAVSALTAHADEPVYYRTDHHWTTLGAFYAFRAWAGKALLQAPELDHYDVRTVTEDFEGTVAAKVGSPGMKDTIEAFVPKEETACVLTYNRSDDVRHTLYQENALQGRDKYAYFLGGNYGLIETQTDARSGRSILVIKDSYAHCFVPFLTEYFDQVDLLDLRYYNEPLSALLEEKQYTDILFLYNAAGFAEDTSLAKLGL